MARAAAGAQAGTGVVDRPFVELGRAVAADEIVHALERIGFTQREIAAAAGATDRSVRNWGATGAIRADYGERIRELAEVSLLLATTMTPRGVRQWFSARNRLLDGRRPLDLVATAERDRVREAAASFVDGSYA